MASNYLERLASSIKRLLDGRNQTWLVAKAKELSLDLTQTKLNRIVNLKAQPDFLEFIAIAESFGIQPTELMSMVTDGAGGPVNLEFGRLKSMVGSIPEDFFLLWPKLKPGRQALCLYVLTRDKRFVSFLSDETLKQLESVLRSADLEKNLPSR